MKLSIHAVPILKDNYAWLLRDNATGAVAVVDPAESAPVISAIEAAGRRLDMILLTHHHTDHVADTDVVRARYPNCIVVGAAADAHRLPRLDQLVREGDMVKLGRAYARVIETPGHTLGQVNYFFSDGPFLLSGDTLFSLGCGRLIEGTAADMFSSLRKLSKLPDDTLVCCGHEYTENNAIFALSVDPNNVALVARAQQAREQRISGKPTIPSRLGDEKRANPFLLATSAAELADVRARKDRF